MSELTFDKIEDEYESIVEDSISFSGLRHDFFMQAKADLLERLARKHLGDPKSARLVDIGCGVGRLHAHIKDRFDSIDGCDVSERSITRARRENPFATYSTSSGDRLPYADAGFDLAVTACVMHHVVPSQWDAFLAEMRRVVRPGGLVIIIEHNPFNPLTRLAVSRCAFDADAVLLAPRRSEKLLKAAGCSKVSSHNFLFLPSAAGWARAIEAGLRRVPLGAQYATVGLA
ncbi:methylase [Devosia pacifica]|uniref:Methylase n=1 Tax=Devosia pacifica TaxID=1335967 RepID=A0A918SB85_9HYPH|nr:class I SAM-dependent methyltransferase [Devosia pacifica]GHA32425.1 methylase [Devosia pacifica]